MKHLADVAASGTSATVESLEAWRARLPPSAAAPATVPRWPDQWREEHLLTWPEYRPADGRRSRAMARRAIGWASCTACSDEGHTLVQDPGGYWTAVPCRCEGLSALVARFNAAGLPPQLHDATTVNTVWDWYGAGAQDEFERYVSGWTPGAKGYLFHGVNGAGKTRLGALFARELMMRGVRTRFIRWAHLLDDLRSSYATKQPEWKVTGELLEAPVVVFDDIGAEQRSEWAGVAMERILGERLEQGQTTILTTNISPHARRGADLRDAVGARVFSRMRGAVKAVEMPSQDRRGEAVP